MKLIRGSSRPEDNLRDASTRIAFAKTCAVCESEIEKLQSELDAECAENPHFARYASFLVLDEKTEKPLQASYICGASDIKPVGRVKFPDGVQNLHQNYKTKTVSSNIL